MKYYLIEVTNPYNSYNEIIKKICLSKKEAEKWIANYINGDWSAIEELPKTEWDDRGPNWKNLITYLFEDETIITLDEVENDTL